MGKHLNLASKGNLYSIQLSKVCKNPQAEARRLYGLSPPARAKSENRLLTTGFGIIPLAPPSSNKKKFLILPLLVGEGRGEVGRGLGG